jgi:hypothetical protein
MQAGNAMPDVDMKTNDGDNGAPPAMPAFANGKDVRVFEGGPSGSDPAPAKPGANS